MVRRSRTGTPHCSGICERAVQFGDGLDLPFSGDFHSPSRRTIKVFEMIKGTTTNSEACIFPVTPGQIRRLLCHCHGATCKQWKCGATWKIWNHHANRTFRTKRTVEKLLHSWIPSWKIEFQKIYVTCPCSHPVPSSVQVSARSIKQALIQQVMSTRMPNNCHQASFSKVKALNKKRRIRILHSPLF